MKINLYDFDKTIYNGDSSVDFFLYSLKHHPKILVNIPKMAISVLKYKLKKIDKTEMKTVLFSFLKFIPNIEKDVEKFWDINNKKIKTFYMEKTHSDDVIISASPEFLLTPICEYLQVKKLIASKVDSRTGVFEGKNCYGLEKVERLNKEFDSYIVDEAYSDSSSDDPILKLAKKSFYVKGDNLIATDF